MRLIGDIALDAEVRAIASGTIGDGVPVVVNSDGTVSAGGNISPTAGSEVVIDTNDSGGYSSIVYAGSHAQGSSDDDKVVIVFRDTGNSNYGTAVVGTVSGTSISFGSAVVFESAQVSEMECCLDTTQGKILLFYRDNGNSNYGTGIIGTVSGTNISFGTPSVFNSGTTTHISCDYDNYNGKALVAYRDSSNSNYGTALTADYQLNYGSEAVFESASTQKISVTYDPNADRFLISYRDLGNSNYGTSIVATISSSSVSYGTAVVFSSANSDHISSICDTTNNKIVVGFANSGALKAIVGTISSTSVSFGTEALVTSNTAYNNSNRSMAYSPDTGRVLIGYFDSSDASHGKIALGTVSGTGISFDTPLKFNAGTTYYVNAAYVKGTDNFVLHYEDYGNSGYVTSIVIDEGGPNLTSENFIGFAHAAYANGQKATVKTTGSIARNIPQLTSTSSLVGTEVQFEAGDTRNTDATFDSNSNRIVIVYRDVGNSSYGSVVVGTVDPSDNSISFGTPVVFESANSEVGDVVFDSSNNKVVVFYTDNGNSSYGTAIVGTVDSSDNSISFGSATTFLDATSYYYGIDATFDSSNNKIVIAYRDGGDSNKGKAKVGTVSGTSISFGSATEFEAGTTAWIGSTFDTSNNKVVITYQDAGNSDYGTAVVGTVSGTSISFGTPVVFASNASLYTSSVFDSDNSKIVIAYQNNSVSPAQPFAIVGTVSGTSISFGTAVTAGSSFVGIYTHAVYNSNAKKTVVSWADSSDTKGRFSSLSVSGTSITWDTAALYNNGSSDWNAIAFDSSNNRVVIPWAETAGKAVVVKSLGTPEDLTIGQQYFVQTDGTLGTSADDPSVIAGTAIGASDIIVKG